MPALRLAVPCLLALALGCAGAPPPAPPSAAPAPATTSSGGRTFVAERAYEDVRNLAAIGARTSGSDGAERARAYLRGELEKLGLVVEERTIELPAQLAGEGAVEGEALPRFVHVTARIPGRGGRGEVLLGASYDTAPSDDFVNVAANGAASGPALVLELARVFAAEPLDYDTRVVFLDGDLGGSDSRQRMGSRLWARELRDSGRLDDIRLAMFFRQVCDPDLHFERDLFSNRAYREAVWRAAQRTGHADAFPPDAGFGTPSGSHHSLIEGGMRRVVALVDDAFGGTESPGALTGTADDDLAHCSAASLGVTGSVAVQSIEDLTRMLSKVDRLSPGSPGSAESPEAEGPGEVEAPAAGTPDEPASDAAPAPEGAGGSDAGEGE